MLTSACSSLANQIRMAYRSSWANDRSAHDCARPTFSAMSSRPCRATNSPRGRTVRKARTVATAKGAGKKLAKEVLKNLDWDHRSCAQKELECRQSLLSPPSLPSPAPHLAAEPYPDHPVTLIVPYAAGGSSDVLARLLGERLSKSLGQPIVIDNRAGAGSRIGIEIAAKSAPDGYTLLLADMPHTIVPAIQKGVHYDPVRDFTPIGLIGTASMFFFVNPAVKAETAAGLRRAREGRPGKNHHRFGRNRQRHPPHRGAVSGQDRHQARACAVSRRRPGHERSGRRSRAVGLHHDGDGELGSRSRSHARSR